MTMALAATSVFKPVILKLVGGMMVLARVVASGSYPALGDPIDLSPLYRYGSGARLLWAFGFGKSGYLYQYDKTNAKFMVRVATTTGANIGLAEHATAAYNAAVVADEIYVIAIFANTQG